MDVLNNLKALTIVLVIAIAVFAITKPVCFRFMTPVDWTRRRNVWFILTIFGFLSPNFWIYAICALPVMYWAGSKDGNPVALYIFLLFVVQPDSFQLPELFDAKLTELNNFRILAIAVLVPYALRLHHQQQAIKAPKFGVYDFFIISYIALQLLAGIPYESFTNTLRRCLSFSWDALLVYYVFSRSCITKKKLIEVMASFCLVCAIFAPIGLFESLKVWLLYAQISTTWEANESFAYLFRADTLRARASTGHALGLGGLCAMAFGFWLYLGKKELPKSTLIIGCVWLWAGLIAAYSRGPWVFAILVLFIYVALRPRGFENIFKLSMAGIIVLVLIIISPLGSKFIDNLPFVGTVDSSNVDYRQLLAIRSWEIIQKNLLFGDPFFMSQMEDLRQGQGIVDLVNAYAAVALGTGLLGLVLCFGPVFLALLRSFATVSKVKKLDSDLADLGSVLIACMCGLLFFIGTAGMDSRFYVWLGMIVGFAAIKIQSENSFNN